MHLWASCRESYKTSRFFADLISPASPPFIAATTCCFAFLDKPLYSYLTNTTIYKALQMNFTFFLLLPPVSEGPNGVDIKRILLLAHSGIPLLDLGDLVLLVHFPAINRQALLLQLRLLLFGELMERPLRAAAELRRELLYFQLLLYLLIFVPGGRH